MLLLSNKQLQQFALLLEQCALFFHQFCLLNQQFFYEAHQITIARQQAQFIGLLTLGQAMRDEGRTIEPQTAQSKNPRCRKWMQGPILQFEEMPGG